MGIYMAINFVIWTIWAGVAYYFTDRAYFFLIMCLGSLFLMAFARSLVFFYLNECDYFQDVEKLNKQIDRHNKEIAEKEKRKAEIQQKFLDGTLVLPPPKPEVPKPPPKPMPETQEEEEKEEEPEELEEPDANDQDEEAKQRRLAEKQRREEER